MDAPKAYKPSKWYVGYLIHLAWFVGWSIALLYVGVVATAP